MAGSVPGPPLIIWCRLPIQHPLQPLPSSSHRSQFQLLYCVLLHYCLPIVMHLVLYWPRVHPQFALATRGEGGARVGVHGVVGFELNRAAIALDAMDK
jgi:hypothetical protein